MRALARAIDGLELPAVEKICREQQGRSVRGPDRDDAVGAARRTRRRLAASTRLFRVARTPKTMAKLTVKQIEQLIYPVSFYRNKART